MAAAKRTNAARPRSARTRPTQPRFGTPTRKHIPDDRALAVALYLESELRNGILPYGAKTRAFRKFNLGSEQIVRRLWTKAEAVLASGQSLTLENMKSHIKTRSGHRRDPAAIQEMIREAPMSSRKTYRCLAKNLDGKVSHGTLYRMSKRGELWTKKVSKKPLLTEQHKLTRLSFALSLVDHDTGIFSSMMDRVHIDEKLFKVDGGARNYILVPGEAPPVCVTRHKGYMKQIMVLAAATRPRLLNNGEYWNGLIGVWPFGKMVEAKRSSINRDAGTLEFKPSECNRASVTRMLIDEIIPAIRMLTPKNVGGLVTIQQDNAPPHVTDGGAHIPELVKVMAGGRGRLGIRIEQQPAQSPDFNVFDLGLFNSMDKAREQEDVSNEEELFAEVERVFWDLSPVTVDSVWLSLQLALLGSMEVDGGNHNMVRHTAKAKRKKEGNLEENVRVSKNLMRRAKKQIKIHKNKNRK